jgi:hypothetical protein
MWEMNYQEGTGIFMIKLILNLVNNYLGENKLADMLFLCSGWCVFLEVDFISKRVVL